MNYIEKGTALLKSPWSRLWRIDYHGPDDTTYVLALVPCLYHISAHTLSQMEVETDGRKNVR